MTRVCCLFLLLAVAAPATATDPGLFVQPSGPPTFVSPAVSFPTREGSSFGSLNGPPRGPLHTLLYPFTIGEGCRMPVGCSSLAAERTFFFGSCRQFYTPGNKCSVFPGGVHGGGRGVLASLNGYNGGFHTPGCPDGGCR